MYLNEIYKNLDVYMNQDGTDDYFGVDDFNRIIEEEQINFIIDVMKEEENKPNISRPMTDFLLAATTQAASTTQYFWALPSDYLRMMSMTYIPTSGIKQPVEFISAREFVRRTNDILSPPLAENPVAYIEDYGGSRYFQTLPRKSTGTFGLFYIKKPSTPFLDYYINTSYELVFLYSYDSLTSITTGTYRDGTAMSLKTGASSTVELEIPIEFHNRFLERLMERMGVKDRDVSVINYSMVKDQQDQIKT